MTEPHVIANGQPLAASLPATIEQFFAREDSRRAQRGGGA